MELGCGFATPPALGLADLLQKLLVTNGPAGHPDEPGCWGQRQPGTHWGVPSGAQCQGETPRAGGQGHIVGVRGRGPWSQGA